MLTEYNEAFADLLDSMIGSRSTPSTTFTQPGLATWVASTLRREMELRKTLCRRPWIDLRTTLTVCAYLALSTVLWTALLLMAHQ